jgi:lysylphosphatidylglycerol synthetase-like protein (DUF2156 family)
VLLRDIGRDYFPNLRDGPSGPRPGTKQKPASTKLLPTDALKELTEAHNQLAQLVAPVSPATLRALSPERRNRLLPMLGPIPLVRRMIYLSTVLTATLVWLIVTKAPFEAIQNAGLTTLGTSTPERLSNTLYLVSAAALGAAFFALFTASRYVKNVTYDERFEPAYWMRFVLGIVGGFVLATIVGVRYFHSSSTITAPLLALLGGFAADVVYRILRRIVETIEAAIEGGADTQKERSRREARADAALRAVAERARLERLTNLKAKARVKDDDELAEEIDRLLCEMKVQTEAGVR